MIEMFVLRGMKQGLNVKGEIIFDGDIWMFHSKVYLFI
jgi:hypothetical protein